MDQDFGSIIVPIGAFDLPEIIETQGRISSDTRYFNRCQAAGRRTSSAVLTIAILAIVKSMGWRRRTGADTGSVIHHVPKSGFGPKTLTTFKVVEKRTASIGYHFNIDLILCRSTRGGGGQNVGLRATWADRDLSTRESAGRPGVGMACLSRCSQRDAITGADGLIRSSICHRSRGAGIDLNTDGTCTGLSTAIRDRSRDRVTVL